MPCQKECLGEAQLEELFAEVKAISAQDAEGKSDAGRKIISEASSALRAAFRSGMRGKRFRGDDGVSCKAVRPSGKCQTDIVGRLWTGPA